MTQTAAEAKKTWTEATAPLRLSLVGRTLRELIAISFWLYLILDTFVVDLTAPVLVYSPGAAAIFAYRFLILLGVTAGAALLLSRPKFWATIGYVLVYPVIVILWTIPRALFKNWPLLVVFLPAIHSIISNFRINFVLLTLALISATAVVSTSSPVAIVTAMLFLLLYLARHFLMRVRAAFAPSTVFANVGAAMRDYWETIQSTAEPVEAADMPRGSAEYENRVAQSLANRYMAAAALHVVARRLRALHETRQLDLYFVAALLYTFLLTAAVYAFLFIGLVRVDPASFSALPSPYEMVGYSIGTMLHFQLSDIRPLSFLAQMMTYSELFASIVIALLLVFIIFTSTRERYRNDVASIAEELADSSRQLEAKMLADYDLTVRAVELRLMRFNAHIADWCLRSRYGASEAKQISAEIAELAARVEGTDLGT